MTDKKTVFEQHKGIKLSYGTLIEGAPFIASVDLLFQKDIQKIDLQENKSSSLPYIFSYQGQDLLGFDVLAACFYFLSRYEEYLPSPKDDLGRFKAENSWAKQNDCLSIPLVDRWIELLAEALESKFSIAIAKPIFHFIPTYDIDIAFAYKNKGFFLSLAAMGKQVMRGQFKDLSNRLKVLLRKARDPYDNFLFINQLHEHYGLDAVFFFLVAQRRSRLDKNTSINNKEFQSLIQQTARKSKIGLHASGKSFEQPLLFLQERKSLTKIAQREILYNRNHYLRFQLPETYRRYAQENIVADFSMGFHDQVGFRAGTCSPFLFFDLPNNQTSTLTIYPLLFMENALETIGTEQSILKTVKNLIGQIADLGGCAVTLFHNQSFAPNQSQDWKKIYEQIVKFACSKQSEKQQSLSKEGLF